MSRIARAFHKLGRESDIELEISATKSQIYHQKQADKESSATGQAGYSYHFYQKLFEASKGQVSYTVAQKDHENQPKKAILNIAGLQRLLVQHLREKIAACAKNFYENQGNLDSQRWNDLSLVTHKYCKLYRFYILFALILICKKPR